MDYFSSEGLNSSLLSAYYNDPEHWEVSYRGAFTDGHVYETIAQDYFSGSSEFDKEYYKVDYDGEYPDNLFGIMKNPDKFEVLNKDGSRSKVHKNVHAWIDIVKEGEKGKIPVPITKYDMYLEAVKNMAKLVFNGIPMGLLLEDARWQVPHFWNGKKALFDCYTIYEDVGYLFDLKLMADFSNFYRFWRSKYWIQALHYIEGFRDFMDNEYTFYDVYPATVFLVTCKNHMLTKPFQAKEDEGVDKYVALCEECSRWVAMGKPKKGWYELEKLSIGGI